MGSSYEPYTFKDLGGAIFIARDRDLDKLRKGLDRRMLAPWAEALAMDIASVKLLRMQPVGEA